MRISLFSDLLKPLLAAILLPCTLSACASLAGAPPRVIGATQSLAMANRYPMDESIIRFFANDPEARHGLTPKQFRDMVITIHLNAADAQYYDFRTRVSSERREIGLGLDLVLLGFTNYAAVARPGIVNDLSAAAAGIAGARGALDRNVYFDRTLPGLLASMDAQRLRVRTRIAEGLQKSEAEYSMSTAFDDVGAYQTASTLDGAIQNVTAQAVQERQEAERAYNNAVHACESTEDLRANRLRIMNWALAGGRTLGQVQELAGMMNLNAQGLQDDVVDRIESALATSYCTNAGMVTLINNAKQTQWGSGL